MVLGFGSKKKKASAEPVFIRASPSLPELAQQRIPWPENLIDSNVVDESVYSPPVGDGHGGARETSMPGTPVAPHSKLASAPPSAFNGLGGRSRAGSHPLSHSRSARRSKNPPTFNVMVAGAKHTGKSSLLRLILDTSTVSPANTQDQLVSLSKFRSTSGRPTTAISTACVEILQAPAGRQPTLDDRVTLTCIDTPGLDFAEGKEFALDRAVSAVVKYVDLQFAETMGEESKVVRTSKGDQHVHVCIYLIDPDSVVTPSARRAKSRLSAVLHGHSLSPSDLPEPSEYDSGSDDDEAAPGDQGGHSDDGYGAPEPPPPMSPSPDDEHSVDPAKAQALRAQLQTPPASQASPRSQNRLTLAPAEIRVIARLAKRVNVLPVVARADTLTDGRLERVKRAIRRDLQDVGVGGGGGADDEHEHGVFAVWDAEPGALFGRRSEEKENGFAGEDEERQARPVIKLRDRATARGLTRSRSRKSLKSAVGTEYDAPAAPSSPGHDEGAGLESRRTSVASAAPGPAAYNPAFSRAELRARMPFAMIAPERERERARSAASSVTGHGADPKGRFVRRFRWGTVDVLDPQHCDFAALRTAVLGSYMRALKATTKDVLYERFRTEKLLARRATRNITDDDRKRILQDLEL